MRPKIITLTFALALAALALLASYFPTSLAQEGQQQRRKGTEGVPGGCFICGERPGMHTAMFEDADWWGTLSWDACPVKEYLEKNPTKRAGLCQRIKTKLKFTSFKNSCPSFAPYCESEEDKPPEVKCVPPRPETKGPPYFDPQAPCRERQRGSISWSRSRATGVHSFTVSMCGQVIRFKQPDYGTFPNRPLGVKSFDVCCAAWRNSAATNSPCDVRQDIDCDGATNDLDTDPVSYSYRYWAGGSDDFASSSPLTNLPFWKQLHEKMPTPSECKDCKWELISVKYQCDSEARAYYYQATWKCPGSGETRETNETAHMTGRGCPVPPNRSWP